MFIILQQEIIAFVVVSNNPSSIHQSLKQKLVSYAMPRVFLSLILLASNCFSYVQ